MTFLVDSLHSQPVGHVVVDTVRNSVPSNQTVAMVVALVMVTVASASASWFLGNSYQAGGGW